MIPQLENFSLVRNRVVDVLFDQEKEIIGFLVRILLLSRLDSLLMVLLKDLYLPFSVQRMRAWRHLLLAVKHLSWYWKLRL